MKLKWTEPKRPGPECSYDNCAAETPFGVYRIEWKGWKDTPDYTIDFQNDFIMCANTLDDAKEFAQADFDRRLEQSQ